MPVDNQQHAPTPPLFHGRHFDHSVIIIPCVRWYVTFEFSFRDLVEVMAECVHAVSHTPIPRGVQCYVPEFEKRRICYALNGSLLSPHRTARR